MNTGKSIAFFDFDGTITSADSLAVFLRYAKGSLHYYLGIFILSPVIIAFKLGFLSNQKAKEILFLYFLKGMTEVSFNDLCIRFIDERLPFIVRKGALEQIKIYSENKIRVVVVSASPINWVRPWCDKRNLDCIATMLEIKDGKLTGRISGYNCHGNEKVNRIKSCYDLTQYDMVYAYGDTKGDLPMLSLASEKYYKPFREKK